MNTLVSYLVQRLPEGLAYPDARQLCLQLFCNVDGMPSELQPVCSRAGLADAFADLGKRGWIREAGSHAMESRHWAEVISSIFKQGPDVVDLSRGNSLARMAGLFL